MSNAVGIAFFGLSVFAAAIPTAREHIVIKPVVNQYQASEREGCIEVMRTCQARKRMEKLWRK